MAEKEVSSDSNVLGVQRRPACRDERRLVELEIPADVRTGQSDRPQLGTGRREPMTEEQTTDHPEPIRQQRRNLAAFQLQPGQLRIPGDHRTREQAISEVQTCFAEHAFQVERSLHARAGQPHTPRIQLSTTTQQQIANHVRPDDLRAIASKTLAVPGRRHELAFLNAQTSPAPHTNNVVTRIAALRGQTKTGGPSEEDPPVISPSRLSESNRRPAHYEFHSDRVEG
ncbi:hypothetical protein ACWEIJ_32985 [Lentzea sp. NPDC004789]